MELRHLRYFVAVAEELHFGRAAARLHLATPSLSQQIRALEREVGAPLLDRGNRGVTLTPAGAAMLTEAHGVLAAADTAIRAARQAAADRPALRIGLLNGVSAALAGRLEASASTVAPGRPVRFTGGPTAQQLAGLRSGELDLALVRLPVPADGLVLRTVDVDRLGVLMSPQHPLAHNEKVSAAELAGQNLILFPRDLAPGCHEDLLAQLAAIGAAVRLSDTAVGHAQLRTVLPHRTDAISIGTARAAITGELVHRPLAEGPLLITIAAARRTRTTDPAAAAVIELLVDRP